MVAGQRRVSGKRPDGGHKMEGALKSIPFQQTSNYRARFACRVSVTARICRFACGEQLEERGS